REASSASFRAPSLSVNSMTTLAMNARTISTTSIIWLRSAPPCSSVMPSTLTRRLSFSGWWCLAVSFEVHTGTRESQSAEGRGEHAGQVIGRGDEGVSARQDEGGHAHVGAADDRSRPCGGLADHQELCRRHRAELAAVLADAAVLLAVPHTPGEH